MGECRPKDRIGGRQRLPFRQHHRAARPHCFPSANLRARAGAAVVSQTRQIGARTGEFENRVAAQREPGGANPIASSNLISGLSRYFCTVWTILRFMDSLPIWSGKKFWQARLLPSMDGHRGPGSAFCDTLVLTVRRNYRNQIDLRHQTLIL